MSDVMLAGHIRPGFWGRSCSVLALVEPGISIHWRSDALLESTCVMAHGVLRLGRWASRGAHRSGFFIRTCLPGISGQDSHDIVPSLTVSFVFLFFFLLLLFFFRQVLGETLSSSISEAWRC